MLLHQSFGIFGIEKEGGCVVALHAEFVDQNAVIEHHLYIMLLFV